MLVGTSTGHVIQFTENEPYKRIKAHQSAVIIISPAKDGFITSSIECFKLWGGGGARAGEFCLFFCCLFFCWGQIFHSKCWQSDEGFHSKFVIVIPT